MKEILIQEFEKLLKFLRITTPKRLYWFTWFLIVCALLMIFFFDQEKTGRSLFDEILLMFKGARR